MIRFFRAKKTRNKYKAIVFRVKKRYSNKMQETHIRKTKSILIYGYESSGKTHELVKLWNQRKKIYRLENFIFFSATDSISEVLYKHIDQELVNKFIATLEPEKQLLAFQNQNKQFFKLDVLKFYSNNAALFIDDIDKFSGKKLEILKELIPNSNITLATAKSEKTINKTIFNQLKHKQFTPVELSTKASFDITNYILITALLPFALSGNYMIVMMLLLANRYVDKGLGK